MHPKQIVEQGYNRIAEQYRAWASGVRVEERARYTAFLLEKLPPGAEVLELGSGAGLPTTRQLAEKFKVTGVDISARQIMLARRSVPAARFIRADMTQLEFPPASFDAVTAFYSISHVPRAEHSRLLGAIARWLRPGGLFAAALSAHDEEAGYEDDWLGAPMFWSGWDSATNQRLVTEAGLHILSAREETAEEDGQPVTFLWIVAQKGRQLPPLRTGVLSGMDAERSRSGSEAEGRGAVFRPPDKKGERHDSRCNFRHRRGARAHRGPGAAPQMGKTLRHEGPGVGGPRLQ